MAQLTPQKSLRGRFDVRQLAGGADRQERSLAHTDRLRCVVRADGESRHHLVWRAPWRGLIRRLPESEAANIPLALSSKAGGPVPVKPNSDPEVLVPQTQQYLISIDGVDSTIESIVAADLPSMIKVIQKLAPL